MTSVPHESTVGLRGRSVWADVARMREFWASLAIVAMWLAVLVDAVWGRDFVSTNGAGTQTTVIPSAIGVALFAFLGTGSLAKFAFERHGQ